MISLNMILGSFEEPFLQAALDSAHNLCDEFVIVDTDPGNNPNIEIVHKWFTEHIWEMSDEALVIVDMPRGEDKDFSFAAARDLARQNSAYEWCLRLDADEVLHEKDISYLKQYIASAVSSAVEVTFYHHMVYPCLYQYVEPKIILFKRDRSYWTKGVHETLSINGPVSKLHEVKYNHYGYCRGQAEVFKRWKLYTDIDNKPHWYDNYDPNNILTDRLSVCKKYDTSHPKYVESTLEEMFGENYDACPFVEIPTHVGFSLVPHMVGLLYICYNDESVEALNSLLDTINVPTIVYIADMRSENKYVEQINMFRIQAKESKFIAEVIYDRFTRVESLAATMNKAFKYFIGRTDIKFVGWFHPDMRAEKGWLGYLALTGSKPGVGKVSAYNTRDAALPPQHNVYNGHEQAYLIPKYVLQEIGLFDEEYLGIGGREDWDLNRRIRLNGYSIIIEPHARVWHKGMETRGRKDQTFFEQMNKNHYAKKWATDKETD